MTKNNIALVSQSNPFKSLNNYKEIENIVNNYPNSDWEFIKDNIPDFLKKGMGSFNSKTEKYIYLNSALVTYGSVMIYINGKYGNKVQYPMLYLIVVGSAASNKSIINISNGILQKLNNIIIEQSEELDKKHQIEHNIWKKLSKKDPTLEEPKKPPYCVVSISPDITKAKLIMQLSDNKYVPSMIICDEADTITALMKSEHGSGISYIYRTAFHHDVISQQLKTNNQHFKIQNPKLAIIIGGTKNQIKRFIGGVENGLFSRFTMIEIDDGPIWNDISPCSRPNDSNRYNSRIINNINSSTDNGIKILD